MPFSFPTHTDNVVLIHTADTDNVGAAVATMSSGVFNVRETGAKGDNVTDDTSAILAADAACSAAGGVLYFPPSAGYRLAGNATLASNFHVHFGASLNPDGGKTVMLTGQGQLPFCKCFGGAGTIALAANSVPRGYPQWWGAKGDGVTDDTNAVKAALASGLAIIALPSCKAGAFYKMTSQLMAASISIEGDDPACSVLKWPKALGFGVPAIISSGDRIHCRFVRVGFLGPGPRTPVLGVKSANMDGVRCDGQLMMDDCWVAQFDAGVIVNNGPTGGQTGHFTAMNGAFNSNYYNIFDYSDGGDTQMIGTDLTGAGMASIGITGQPLSGEGFLQGWNMFHVHCGYAPFGVYQEAGGTGSFMKDNNFIDVRFEGCGNAALYTENATAGFENNEFSHVGFSYHPDRRLASKPNDYCCVIGNVAGHNRYAPFINPFTAGNRGVWYIHNLNGGFEKTISANEPDTIAAGTKAYLTIHFQGLGIAGLGSIASGQASVVISTPVYLGDVSGLYPSLTLQGTAFPGLTNPQLTFDSVSSACVQSPQTGPAAVVGPAGNVDAGTHQYYCSFSTNLGGPNIGHTDSGPGSAVVTAAAGGSQIILTDLPQGSGDVSLINIWRSKAGNAGTIYLLASLAPGTTSYTDNTADASLGAAIVRGDTSSGTQFTVHVLGGLPTGTIPFSWRLS